MLIPWFGDVARFTLDDDQRERLASKEPPRLTSGRYTKEFNEVKALGALGSTERTQAQTYLAYFFADNPILIWNRALRLIAVERGLGIGRSARLFALANMATADALQNEEEQRGALRTAVAAIHWLLQSQFSIALPPDKAHDPHALTAYPVWGARALSALSSADQPLLRRA